MDTSGRAEATYVVREVMAQPLGASSTVAADPRGKVLPLNSKRLKAAQLQRLARALSLPTSTSGDELRQMIDGKLEELEKEPRNVTVVITEAECGAERLALWDDDGSFLDVHPETPEGEGDEDRTDSEPTTEELQSALDRALEENALLKTQMTQQQAALEEERERVEALEKENERLQETTSPGRVSELEEELKREKDRMKSVWRMQCEQLVQYDSEVSEKETQITELKAELAKHAKPDGEVVKGGTGRTAECNSSPSPCKVTRRGKAPPVDAFTGEDTELRLEDWLPTLERASSWNGWTHEELLMQFAGHLRGRALQEWNLLGPEDKESYEAATRALRTRLDPGGRALAAQDFRHTAQRESEPVSDFVRRLERTFQIAYGRDGMSVETRNTLLHSQLQEGLCYNILKAPAVSGAQSYRELCLAAKNEEKRQAELEKRVHYRRGDPNRQVRKPAVPPAISNLTPSVSISTPSSLPSLSTSSSNPSRVSPGVRRCYNCGNTGHLARDCKEPKKESPGKPKGFAKPPPKANLVVSVDAHETPEDALDYLFSSDSEEGDVCLVRVHDKGSRQRCADVEVQGVAACGVVDTGADITIMGGELFKRVAAVARLRKKDFKPADRKPYTYGDQPFSLDGRMDLDVSFDGKTMCTPVYIKMDAKESLLLSEGVCRQLGIVTYHSQVVRRKGKDQGRAGRKESAHVPAVRVRLVESVRLLPLQSMMATVEFEEGEEFEGPLLLEATRRFAGTGELRLGTALVCPTEDRCAQVLLTNSTGFTQKLEQGVWVARASAAEVISEDDPVPDEDDEEGEESAEEVTQVRTVTPGEDAELRKQKLATLLREEGADLPWQERSQLHSFLLEHHQAFSLEDGERGETSLVQMQIDTGDSSPRRQPPRRIPFAVRQEVATQLRKMQDGGVIRPSSSPWASPVVLVRKRDGTLRFCIDYRDLNSVTKADTFPLPRVDELLDQLGKSKYFSTLDLASGYWQVQVHPDSREKTAFVTHQGLYEFQVMPFGLKNAPAVFQRLMQRVLMGLNPEEGPDFVSVYLDDVLVFSETLEGHLRHLCSVIERLAAAGLKLKPSKCHFIREEVEYLGHIITPHGLKPNPRHVAAVIDFPAPQNVKEVRQFLGLSSYYRRFVPGFAKIAKPIHTLTQKGAVFEWNSSCQAAFETLKSKLVQSPVLAYPDFNKSFVLETDASIRGLGAVLSQTQADDRLHPVAYASRALSPAEKNYAVTELETLAVVWAFTHFHVYLYGHEVTVYTDHTAVKAVLETPNPSGKHARWWSRVFGSGVKSLHIVYRAGKENTNADALSRNPVGLPSEEGAGVHAQVAAVDTTATTIEELLVAPPDSPTRPADLSSEQCKDKDVLEIITFLESGCLSEDKQRARKIAAQEPSFTLLDGILYFLDSRRGGRRVVVPRHLRQDILEENHSGPMAGHFSGERLYKTLMRHWWWPGMYTDTVKHCASCPQCAIVSGSGRVNRPPLHPIPVQRAFQIVGVDVMDLPMTEAGNKHVVVFQDFLTKWPLVFPVSDQKAITIARLLAEKVIPVHGVPEALLSDRGTNLLSHLMLDLCKMLGIKKLNTTAYHPQTDGMVERFNRTLKTALRKHAAKFGAQWDTYLSGILWAYRNTPHEATGEKPSFLLFGFDCRTPSEAALLPPAPLQIADVDDYRQELVLSLSSARELAAKSIQRAQKRYKKQFDKRAKPTSFKIGSWVLIRFPHDETGKNRKLSRPWHGPYRISSVDNPDISAAKVYFPQDGNIQVHQSRVKVCPPGFPSGYYWYGGKRHGPGRPPKWVVKLLEPSEDEPDQSAEQPDQSAEQPESESVGGRMQSTRQSGRYPLRRRVAPPPDRYQ